MKEKMNMEAPCSAKTTAIFALSEVATNPIATILTAFLVYFYTDVIGMNAAIVGMVIFQGDGRYQRFDWRQYC